MKIVPPTMRSIFFFSTLLCFQSIGAQKEENLFNAKDKELIAYLSSPQFFVDGATLEMVQKSRQRMKAALKIYAKRDRQQRDQFFKGDIWEREDQRENYFALQRWLQEVSPIKKSKEKK